MITELSNAKDPIQVLSTLHQQLVQTPTTFDPEKSDYENYFPLVTTLVQYNEVMQKL